MEKRSVSIADQVFEILEHDILSGEYVRGETLTETKLSEKLGVSRTPIRESLRRLEQEHLIEMSSKGAVIIGISKEDIELIYEMRLRIEGLAVRMVAEKATTEDINALREIVDIQEFYTTKGDADNIKDADSRFHNKIYSLCGSMPLCDTLTDLHKRIIKYRKASVSNKSRALESLEEHRKIYEALLNRNGELAEQLAITHIKNAKQHINANE